MSKNFIKFIGTGSGKVSLKRCHSSFLISTENYNLLIDCGDGISKALLLQNISFHSIDGIVLSHLHPDHYTGLASLIVQMKLNDRKNDLQIFVHQNLTETIEKFIYHSYLFQEKMDFQMNIIKFIDNELLKINDSLSFLPKQNSHLDNYVQYAKKGNPRLSADKLSFSCSSFLFKINEKNIFYTGDIGNKKDLNLFDDFKIDFMITEVTHVSMEEIISSMKKIKPQKLFLTHISDEDDDKLLNLKNLISKKEKGLITLAFDGLLFEV